VKNITWMKNGKRLSTSEPILRVDAVRREDRGMFQCFVRNDQDSAQSTAELKLGGRCKNTAKDVNELELFILQL
jgi:Down syndrome cell adhesion protein 1